MQNDYDFIKRRIDDAEFYFWLFEKKHTENISSETYSFLAEEYKKKYEGLLKKYMHMQAPDTDEYGRLWFEDL